MDAIGRITVNTHTVTVVSSSVMLMSPLCSFSMPVYSNKFTAIHVFRTVKVFPMSAHCKISVPFCFNYSSINWEENCWDLDVSLGEQQLYSGSLSSCCTQLNNTTPIMSAEPHAESIHDHLNKT